MAIFLQFDPAEHEDGTTMASLGWTEYPALDASLVNKPAPAFQISGGAVTNITYASTLIPPRLIYRLGSPIVRGETRMAHGEHCVVLANGDARSFITMSRGFYSGTTYAIIFEHFVNGVAQNAFRFHVRFNLDSPNGPALPSEVDVAWVVNGTNLEVYVQGRRRQAYNINSGQYESVMPIPAALIGSDGAGFWPQFANNYAVPLLLRDNAELMYVTDVAERRATVDSSLLDIAGICTKAGATHVQVELRNDTGGQLFAGLAAVAGGAWSISTGAIPKAYGPATVAATLTSGSDIITVLEVYSGAVQAGHLVAAEGGLSPNIRIAAQLSGTPGGAGSYQLSANASATIHGLTLVTSSELIITAMNVGGGVESRVANFTMPRTLTRLAARFGNNNSLTTYYGGFWPFNDLGRAIQWRTTAGTMLPVRADPAYFNASNGYGAFVPNSEVDMAPNGSPRKFPTNPAHNLTSQLPWYPEPGVYVMDMTAAPDLAWSFAGTGGAVTTDLDYFGPKLHRVTIASPYIPNPGGSGWRIDVVRNPGKPNDGMPATAWTLSIRKLGASGEWTESFLDWMRQSGIGHYRWMSGQLCNEPRYLPRNITTAARRATIADQGWHNQNNTLPEVPFELIVDLHNRTGKDLWYNFPRTADESYVRALAALVRDRLDPSLKFIYTMSNEVWNFNFWQTFAYAEDGLAIGLGKGIATTAAIVDGSTTIDILSAIPARVQLGQKITGKGIAAGTTIVAQGTGTGRAGTYELSQAATLTATVDIVYDAPTFGGDEAFDLSAIPTWTNGIAVTAGQLVRSYNIYRALTSHTSTVDPITVSDNPNFEYVQSGDRAAHRSHVEHIIWLNDLVISELGGQAAHDARCMLVAEQQDAQLALRIAHYLDWGDLRGRLSAVCGAHYFGNSSGPFRWSTATAAVRTATATLTGAGRIAAWIGAAREEATRAVNRRKANALALVAMLEERGLAEGDVEYWSYEGGPEYDWQFANSALAATGAGPIDQAALLADIMAFHKSNHYDLIRDFYRAIADICGGRHCYFDSFYPLAENSAFFPVGGNGMLFWGMSKDVFDRADTSSKYRGLRDISVEIGGGQIIATPARRRRRLAPAQLS